MRTLKLRKMMTDQNREYPYQAPGRAAGELSSRLHDDNSIRWGNKTGTMKRFMTGLSKERKTGKE